MHDLKERVNAGFVIEGRDEMDDDYYSVLRDTLLVTADTELVSVAALHAGLAHAPTTRSKMTLLAIMQDEIAHAHLAYRLLADLGEDTDNRALHRAPCFRRRGEAVNPHLAVPDVKPLIPAYAREAPTPWAIGTGRTNIFQKQEPRAIE